MFIRITRDKPMLFTLVDKLLLFSTFFGSQPCLYEYQSLNHCYSTLFCWQDVYTNNSRWTTCIHCSWISEILCEFLRFLNQDSSQSSPHISGRQKNYSNEKISNCNLIKHDIGGWKHMCSPDLTWYRVANIPPGSRINHCQLPSDDT